MSYSAKDILDQLDDCALGHSFPMLDNGYVYPITSRLTAYRDQMRWILLIEVFGFNYRGIGLSGISNCLHFFGNCLRFKPGIHNKNFLFFFENSEEGSAFDPDTQDHLNPGVNSILIRKQTIPVQHEVAFYLNKGINVEAPPNIFVWEFLRGLLPEYRQLLLASELEIRARIARDLEQFIRLDEWHHPDLAIGELPSHCETFQQLAQALETGDASFYQPSQPANSHWTNWPSGGTL
ncbi:MAG: hypothetical protein AAF587_24250 [Bacteroidota bacterium]